DFARNHGPAVAGFNPDGHPGYKVSTLTDPKLASLGEARWAYVVAQEHALHGDAAAALASLDAAQRAGFKPNRFDQRVIASIRGFAAASGANGASAEQAAAARFERASAIAYAIAAVGMFFGLVGPFADLLANIIVRRARRIGEVQTRLDEQRSG